ncbi:hypothetical protein C1878_00595 [Gordonibacter sp. 28C]|uniref:hypothetical protein n=1 Tax=Gordonibacter sp. 28C TaxID=2078569 RepID=UPI000DF73937|nr:hypothetical protein [Gordonibacter sp. 28C]RDB64393.1 hypothetical protein C1878_00595 [Gordonibacter sp. 28C]
MGVPFCAPAREPFGPAQANEKARVEKDGSSETSKAQSGVHSAQFDANLFAGASFASTMEPSVLQRMKGTAMNEKAFRRTGWLRIVLTLLCITVAGASVNLLTGCASDNIVTVGKLTMSYPDDLSVHREDASVSYLPDGMTITTGTTLTNGNASILIELAEVDDPDGRGIKALEEYWREAAANLASEEKIAETDAKMPGMREMMEGTVLGEPERIVLNGRDALTVSFTIKDTTREVCYYVEADDRIVGAALGIFPVQLYENDPEYFDSMFSSIHIA